MIFDLSVFNKLSFRLISLALTLTLTAACSSSGSSSQARKVATKQTNQQTTESTNLANRRASSNDFYSEQEESISQAYTAMQQGFSKEEVKRLIDDVSPKQFYSINADLQLAKVFLFLGQVEDAETIITRLKQGALPAKHQIPLWLASAQLDAQKGEHLNSIRTLFRLSQLYGQHLSQTDRKVNNELIWQNILNLSATSLDVFKSDFGEEVDSWVNLAKLLENFDKNPRRFSQQIQNWANNHALYSQREVLPEQIFELTQVKPFDLVNVALVLPFTGKLAKQAEAIRDGFFATIDFDTSVNYILVDSASLSVEQVEELVVNNSIDFIVGPLQKDTITKFQQSEILNSINQLNLNTLDSETESIENNYYFSLSPEDEIEQAVNYFIKKGVQSPAIIYADNSRGRRLFEQFDTLWQENTNKQVESVAFQNMSKLGKAVKELLDVGISEKRIKQIEKLFGARVKSEERSRIDIDAIYVIANAQQVRLIKPFFDVNVSKFGNGLPIYSSSSSYLIGETRSEKLDLNGLTFTETPWLLSPQNNAIDRMYEQVGKNDTQLKKLFAFGLDAKNLVPVLQYLSVLPEISIQALSGKLRVDSNNRVKRELKWAQYKQGQVVVVKTINQ